jgi:aspartyl/asparaginyl beta-hydroxylase (cupin superfamily)
MKLFEPLLEARNKKRSKPFGYDCPKVVQEFYDNREVIAQEWDHFKQLTSSIGVPIDELSVDQKSLNQDKKWNALFIAVYGHFTTETEAYFPKTTLLAKKWQHEVPLIFFSTLEPQKHIPPHTGNNPGVLRSQIGIDIAQPEKTGLRVAGKTFKLKNRELLTFDDTFIHEAWNDGEMNRTVLILDSLKPFPHIYNLINRWKIGKMKKTPYVQSVIDQMKARKDILR